MLDLGLTMAPSAARLDRIGVCYCIDRMGLGGTERQLHALIDGLDRRRFEPLLCTLRPSTIDLSVLNCDVLEVPFTSFRSISTLTSLRRLISTLRRRRIAIVQTFVQDATVLGTMAAALSSVPLRIASFRDLGFWREPNKVRQMRAIYPFVHGFIANSHAVARAAEQLDGLSPDRIEVIYNGVGMRPLSSRAAREGPLVVGLVANPNRPVKRVDLFIRAAAVLASRVGGVRFEIVGDGPLRGELESLAASMGIASAVRFRGSVTDVPRVVETFDIGVLSSDSEGLANSILEYMAAGVPTVARRVGGNVEVVRHGETGLLVDGDTPEDLASGIERLLVDPSLRSKMGQQARTAAERDFSLERYVQRHEQYYCRMLMRSVPQPHPWVEVASGGGA
jgi:glycosyltransferase involved in cell wall biosynthesis